MPWLGRVVLAQRPVERSAHVIHLVQEEFRTVAVRKENTSFASQTSWYAAVTWWAGSQSGSFPGSMTSMWISAIYCMKWIVRTLHEQSLFETVGTMMYKNVWGPDLSSFSTKNLHWQCDKLRVGRSYKLSRIRKQWWSLDHNNFNPLKDWLIYDGSTWNIICCSMPKGELSGQQEHWHKV